MKGRTLWDDWQRKFASGGKELEIMSKYQALWEYIQKKGCEDLKLTFGEIQEIAGVPIDHSFLKYKKELVDYGYQAGKISMKEQTVLFHQIKGGGA